VSVSGDTGGGVPPVPPPGDVIRSLTLQEPEFPVWAIQGPWRAPALSPTCLRDPPRVFFVLEQTRLRLQAEMGASWLQGLERDFSRIERAEELDGNPEALGAMLVYLSALAWFIQ